MSETTKDENSSAIEEQKQDRGVESSGVESSAETAFKRKVVAVSVGAVVLLAVLLIAMCYQLIAIGVKYSEKNQLIADIALLDEQLQKGEETIEIRRKAVYIERRARELGYRYANDN